MVVRSLVYLHGNHSIYEKCQDTYHAMESRMAGHHYESASAGLSSWGNSGQDLVSKFWTAPGGFLVLFFGGFPGFLTGIFTGFSSVLITWARAEPGRTCVRLAAPMGQNGFPITYLSGILMDRIGMGTNITLGNLQNRNVVSGLLDCFHDRSGYR